MRTGTGFFFLRGVAGAGYNMHTLTGVVAFFSPDLGS